MENEVKVRVKFQEKKVVSYFVSEERKKTYLHSHVDNDVT